MMSASPALKAEHLSKSFDGTVVVSEASLSLEPGEVLCIYGKNASAKTVLIRMLSGELRPDGGRLFVAGRERRLSGISHGRRLGIYAIFENHTLIPGMTAQELMFLGSYQRCASLPGMVRSRSMGEQAAAALRLFDAPFDIDTPAASLDYADAQLLLLIRAYVQQASVVLVDNGFSSHSEAQLKTLQRALGLLKAAGCAVAFTTSVVDSAMTASADFLVCMKSGRLSEKMPAAQFDAAALADSGQAAVYPHIHKPTRQAAYSFRNLCYQDALIDVSFDVHRGEIVGILGSAGSGARQLLDLLCGNERPEVGQICCGDSALPYMSPKAARRHGVAVIMNAASAFGLIPQLDIPTNIALPSMGRFTRLLALNGRKIRAHSQNVVQRLSIASNSSGRVSHLSAGNQQKVAFGRFISSNAQLFIMDDPTCFLDSVGKTHIYNLMDTLCREGKSILLFTSDVDEALGMCDRILVLQQGKIVCETLGKNTPDQLMALL